MFFRQTSSTIVFFRKKNDHLTASKFGYSSMDWIKQHSPKCRCFVTENPLFLTPEFERQKISICYQFQRHQKMIQKTQQLPFEKINEEFKDLGFQKNPIELQLKLLCFTLYCHLSQLN